MSGSNTTSNGANAGVYGTQGVAAAQNVPGGRWQAATWTDSSGKLWLFGGSGFDSAGAAGYLNDLWEFNPATNQWSWMGGSSVVPPTCSRGNTGCGQSGVYGTLGTPAASNIPGGRAQATTWTDRHGNFWLFGGYGFDSAGMAGNLNDLWEFDPATKRWTWMAGDSVIHSAPPVFGLVGVYGTLGTAAPGNSPGGRTGGVGWVDGNGNLWLFGGEGYDAASGAGLENDLWLFNITSREWAWMGGANTLTIPVPNCSGGGACEDYAPGTYGTQGVPAVTNVPPGRSGAVAWTDGAGKAWLFGGKSYSAVADDGSELNDLWELDLATAQWTWISGSETVVCSSPGANSTVCGQPGIYGAQGTPDEPNTPGGRSGAVGWSTSDGTLWLFGGWGFDSTIAHWGWLDDLWQFQPASQQWTWISGNSLATGSAEDGVYGTLGVGSASNLPGGRELPSGWVDSSDNLWLFGGWGIDSTPIYGDLNDLWVWQGLTRAATPTFSIAAGSYTSIQSVNLEDATPGAAIYYTIDGTTPTVNSSVYSGPIAVGASETLRAIAIAAGYRTSAVASAAYFIQLPPPGFGVGLSAATLTVKSAQQGTLAVTITPQNGFASAVTFACSGLPAGASCSFSPTMVTPAGSAVTTTLTLNAQTLAADARGRSWPFLPASGLALAVGILGLRRPRGWTRLALLGAVGAGLGMISACGGGSGSAPATPSTPSPVSSTVTVTATSGAAQKTATFTLTVD